MDFRNVRILRLLTSVLVLCLLVVSYFGLFVPATYERDVASMAAQGAGQDMVNLFFVLPLLLLTLIYLLKGSKTAVLLYCGTLFYLLYSFVIYCFGVHFNRLFLLYCVILGLSFYSFILMMHELSSMEIQNWFEKGIPRRPIAIFLLIISIIFYLIWLKDIIPAILTDTIPKSVSDYQLLVNPVHVLDIAIVLPGLVITAILLLKKHHLGYVLTPVALVFIIILSMALAAMVLLLQIRGISEDMSVAVIFILIAVISTIFLFLFLKKLKSPI